MTDSEIIKALANCIDEPPFCCVVCPYNHISEDVAECESALLKDCAAVINHCKAEIDRLTKLNSELEKRENTFAKSFYKTGIKDFTEAILADYPEMEFYLNKLVSDLTGGKE